jgi:hypothetical protein
VTTCECLLFPCENIAGADEHKNEHCAHTPNENKMGDGHRERAWLGAKGFSHAKGERKAGGRSLQRLVRALGIVNERGHEPEEKEHRQ